MLEMLIATFFFDRIRLLGNFHLPRVTSSTNETVHDWIFICPFSLRIRTTIDAWIRIPVWSNKNANRLDSLRFTETMQFLSGLKFYLRFKRRRSSTFFREEKI